jgi:hypothetical protein
MCRIKGDRYEKITAPWTRVFARLCFATQALARDPFEKDNWKIKAEPSEGDGKAFDDTLSFKGGKFESKTLKDKGFEAATYEDNTTRAGLGGFKATSKAKRKAKRSGPAPSPQLRSKAT